MVSFNYQLFNKKQHYNIIHFGLACFPSTARITVENGKSVVMSKLQTGDKVLTGMITLYI